MNCFVSACQGKVEVAVALCPHCSVALCIAHLAEAQGHRVGGTDFTCQHVLPSPVGKPR